MEIFSSIRWRQYQPKWPLWQTNKICGRHLIDRISDWPNPRGFTKGVRFVCLNRYIQVNQKPFSQSEIRSIRVLRSQDAANNWKCFWVFFKWAKPGLFLVYFRSFSQHKDKYSTNFTINDKSIDGVLGSRTRGGMMEGADESTELWRHPSNNEFWRTNCASFL